mmetsp:Transcript_22223/g.61667  ORF Transcript_22223/g.61667 Transcript_22223/m.61667 type:complete len:283 (+) Transcript_22223:295-1143(+)
MARSGLWPGLGGVRCLGAMLWDGAGVPAELHAVALSGLPLELLLQLVEALHLSLQAPGGTAVLLPHGHHPQGKLLGAKLLQGRGLGLHVCLHEAPKLHTKLGNATLLHSSLHGHNLLDALLHSSTRGGHAGWQVHQLRPQSLLPQPESSQLGNHRCLGPVLQHHLPGNLLVRCLDLLCLAFGSSSSHLPIHLCSCGRSGLCVGGLPAICGFFAGLFSLGAAANRLQPPLCVLQHPPRHTHSSGSPITAKHIVDEPLCAKAQHAPHSLATKDSWLGELSCQGG